MVDHPESMGISFLRSGRPVWDGFVDIQNGLLFLMANLVEQGNMPVEVCANKVPVVKTHRNRKIRPYKEVAREFSLNVARWVGPSGMEPRADLRMGVLRLRTDAGGTDDVG